MLMKDQIKPNLFKNELKKEREENKAQEGTENQQEGQQEQQQEDEEEPEGDLEEKNITLNVQIKNKTDVLEFKLVVNKEGTLFLDAITSGGKSIDDIYSLSQNTIERLFEFLEQHGIDENFGNFAQSYNVSRKIKANNSVVKTVLSFLKKE